VDEVYGMRAVIGEVSGDPMDITDTARTAPV
jgi:hypothetical protein